MWIFKIPDKIILSPQAPWQVASRLGESVKCSDSW